MCLHLATSFNWGNYSPTADAQKKNPDLDSERLEDTVTWDAFSY